VPPAETNPDVSAVATAPRPEEWYLDLHARGPVGHVARADALVPGLRADLVGRPSCAEEHASLRTLLELDSVS
jgi:hypothetical protein